MHACGSMTSLDRSSYRHAHHARSSRDSSELRDMLKTMRWCRGAGAIFVGAILATLGGCLFPSLDGLEGDGGSASDSAACTTCDGGAVDGNDAKPPTDGPSDVKKINDAVSEPDVAPPPPGSFICGTGTVSDCANCAGFTQPCITCDSTGTKSPPFCVVAGDSCRANPPPGYSTFTNGCDCTNGVSTCPANYQVCHNGQFCHTCGEPMSSGETCKQGGTCNGTTCQ